MRILHGIYFCFNKYLFALYVNMKNFSGYCNIAITNFFRLADEKIYDAILTLCISHRI